MHRRPRSSIRRALAPLTLVASVALMTIHVAPAAALWDTWDWSKARFRTVGGCARVDQGLHYVTHEQVFMQEFGKSGVQQFRVTFKLYPAASAGFEVAYLQNTYVSPPFANDARNARWWLPTGTWHRFSNIVADNEWRVDAHMVWYRGFWRRNFAYTKTVDTCVG
ncbi:MAG: hypothetical protein JWN46_2368 [Acidimicrobiales bacterium]|nr:hypothetical protein [Acidimicrobiales bacterium]